MLNFDFYNPTRILFGEDRLESIDRYVPADATVLITYGGGSAKKKTRLSQYGVGADKIPVIVEQLKTHGLTALSETQDLTLDISQKILEGAV